MSSFYLIPSQYFRVRVNNNHAGRTINDDIIVGSYLSGYLLQTYNSRNSQRLGDNGRVGSFSSKVGGKSEKLIDLRLSRIGRRKFFGNKDDAFTDIRFSFPPFPRKIPEYPLPHELDIADPSPQIIVFHLIEYFPVTIDRNPERPLCIDGILANMFNRYVSKSSILQDQDMNINNIQRLLISQVMELIFKFLQLYLRFFDGCSEPLYLPLDKGFIIQMIKRHLCIEPVEKIGLPDHDAGGYANALNRHRSFHIINVHQSSPNLSSISLPNASTASHASLPSALIVIILPWGQAIVKMLSRLFPSTSKPSLSKIMFDLYSLDRPTNLAAGRACIPSLFFISTVFIATISEVMASKNVVKI